MINRLVHIEHTYKLRQSPAGVLLGSRQVGTTTLARSMDIGKPVVYIDLELPSDVDRTHAGTEFDLVLTYPDNSIHAIEIKRTLSPKLSPSFMASMETIRATRGTIVIPDGDTYQRTANVNVMSIRFVLADAVSATTFSPVYREFPT